MYYVFNLLMNRSIFSLPFPISLGGFLILLYFFTKSSTNARHWCFFVVYKSRSICYDTPYALSNPMLKRLDDNGTPFILAMLSVSCNVIFIIFISWLSTSRSCKALQNSFLFTLLLLSPFIQ